MSTTIKQYNIPKPEKIYSKGNPTKGLNRTRFQAQKTGFTPKKPATFKEPKVSLSMIKPQKARVIKTLKGR